MKTRVMLLTLLLTVGLLLVSCGGEEAEPERQQGYSRR